jgi:hypothetical protein
VELNPGGAHSWWNLVLMVELSLVSGWYQGGIWVVSGWYRGGIWVVSGWYQGVSGWYQGGVSQGGIMVVSGRLWLP